jgi:hypothetical protein
MFDAPTNLPLDPSEEKPQPSPAPGPFVASRPSSAFAARPAKKEPEDILAEIEHDAEPPKKGGEDAEVERVPSSGRGQKKLIIILSVVVLVLILVAGGIFLYRRFMTSPGTPTPSPSAPTPSAGIPGTGGGAQPTPAPAEPGNAEPVVPPTPPTSMPESTSTQAATDTDGDGLPDTQEATLGTDPKSADTDGDGLTDGQEVNVVHANPLIADTDGDGLTDGDEANVWHTDPLKADTDGDGFSDGQEVQNGYNPLGAGKLQR